MTNKDGTLEELPEDIREIEVSKVAIHNVSNNDNKIFEFNIYNSDSSENPEAPTDDSDTAANVLLRIQLVDDLEKEYVLTSEEVKEFEDWLKKRLNGDGEAIYTFNKDELSRTENLVFDKIVYYEKTDL